MPDAGRLNANDPEHIGAYRLLGVLGSGGQGTVYLGRSPSGQQVAVKVLHARMAADSAAVRRFEREVALARQVAAFCTATVLEAGLSEGRPYLVSEYVPGPSLQELIATDGPRKGSGLERLAIATVTALEAIHRAGIVHRDFKPTNVIMGPEGPVVIDFGIARILEATVATTVSSLVGTPAYLAPEQLANQPASEASDLFSWAATMVYAATGHQAFAGGHAAAVMSSILTHEPNLEGVSEPPRALLAACLAKDPRDRPGVDEVLAALTGRSRSARPVRQADAPVRSPTVEEAVPPASSPGADTPVGESSPRGPVGEPSPLDSATPVSSAAQDMIDTGDRPVRTARPGLSLLRGRTGWIAGATACVALVVLAVVFWPFSREPTTGASAGPAVTSGVLGHQGDDIWAVAIEQVAGRPVAVTGSKDDTAQMWDLTTRKPVGGPMAGHTEDVCAVAVGQVGGKPVAVTGSMDDTVRVWDLTTRQPVGGPMKGHTEDVCAVAVGQVAGRPVAVTGSEDDTVRVWDLTTRKAVGEPMKGHAKAIWGVAVGQVAGRPVAVTGGVDHTVRVWDLTTRQPVGQPMTGHEANVYAVAIGQVDSRPVAVTGGADGMVRVWDLTTRTIMGQPMTGHTHIVTSVAVGQVAGRPVAVTGSWDRSARVWDLTTHEPLGQPLTGHTSTVYAVAVGQVAGRPIALTGSRDTALRMWDLSGRTQ
ncbi:serine/threonine-protein kinase [Streptosporangium carneum]|uniref:Protein kinase n=1 Tax=Streptosporangium carneum TaxID=47481 RepID=A0A9W6HWB8_9ACTN|nr:serine/threonine-protein kinase [Streptosporangium carneum]GLK07560.1 protein kinase [Streptosporangium carneum]